jgi:hypothetical protein
MNPPDFYTAQHQAPVNEYRKYLENPAEKCDHPLIWWKNRYSAWPSLAAMAVDVLSIPLMSAECEKVFLSAGYLITC